MALDQASLVALGTLGLQRTGITGRRIRLVDADPLLLGHVSLWKERGKVVGDGINIEAREHLVAIGVGFDLGRIEVEFFPPDEAGLLTLLDDAVEAAAKDDNAVAITDLAQTGVVGQLFMQVIPQELAQAEAIGGNLHQLPLGPNAREKQRELELEKHDRIDGGPPDRGVAGLDQLTRKGEVERRLNVAIEVVLRN
jgi:hypothetical protein